MDKKEKMLREAVRDHYQCNGKYACEDVLIAGSAKEFALGFEAGWDVCLKHLCEIPWDEAMNEIVNYCKEKKKQQL